MEQRVHFVTVATRDLDRARDFYVEGLGWTPTLDVPDEILFFQVAPGVVLGLFEAEAFAADLGTAGALLPAPTGFTLSHNVASPAEVDRVLAQAAAAGATIVKSGRNAAFGGYHGYFSDPNELLWEVAHNPDWQVAEDGRVTLGPIEE
ncbi:glyoxalase [Plantactinospora sp. BC1]|uniref:VOC family protein n=1 Tax=Plantactinospora sp. BC1 TaxID=2108470 RepID=UPI000D156E2E|nr:VOC family protein [Plantactinospora sp. BC1]AVT33509.1 glyoxalase [Plantactinospora sp. BC1]